jgi:hypothetical protein
VSVTVKHFNNLLHEKHVYNMHNVKFGLHPGEFNFRHLNGPMELYFNQQTIVEPYTVPIQMPPFPKHIFFNLDDIAELPNRTLVGKNILILARYIPLIVYTKFSINPFINCYFCRHYGYCSPHGYNSSHNVGPFQKDCYNGC